MLNPLITNVVINFLISMPPGVGLGPLLFIEIKYFSIKIIITTDKNALIWMTQTTYITSSNA